MLTDKLGQAIKLTDVYYASTFTKHTVSMRKLIDDNWAFYVTDKMEFGFMDPAMMGTVKYGRKDTETCCTTSLVFETSIMPTILSRSS